MKMKSAILFLMLGMGFIVADNSTNKEITGETKRTLLNNYSPPTDWTQLDISFNFTVYDENVNTSFSLGLGIGSGTIIKSSEQYKYIQTYDLLTGNECNEYSKTFYLKKTDLDSGFSWPTTHSITANFSSSDGIYLFSNNNSNYDDTKKNKKFPGISIKPRFYSIS